MPLVIVNFPSRKVRKLSNPSDDWQSYAGLAETSRNILELRRLYHLGIDNGLFGVSDAAEKRAKQLGFDHSELEKPQRGALVRNLTDRAQRYRANRKPPSGPKQCAFCGSRKNIMVGHLDGHEAHNELENLVWTCRSCNAHHANALKRSGMGRRTTQFNPTGSGGAQSLGEWVQAVGTIRPRAQGKPQGSIGSSDRNAGLESASTMKTSDAVAMIRATPASARSRFAAQLGKHKGSRGSSRDSVPF